MLTGESLNKKTIEELVAICKNNDNPNNQLNSLYVGYVLKKRGGKCKVYSKNKKMGNDGVAGFVIFRFNEKYEDEGKIARESFEKKNQSC